MNQCCGKTTVKLLVYFCDWAFNDRKGRHKWGHTVTIGTVKCSTSIKINCNLNLLDLIRFDLMYSKYYMKHRHSMHPASVHLMVFGRFTLATIKIYHLTGNKNENVHFISEIQSYHLVEYYSSACLFQINVLQIDVLTKTIIMMLCRIATVRMYLQLLR